MPNGTVHSSCTDPTQASTACYCSCKQDTKEQYQGQQFCQMERDISVWPTKMTRPVKVDYLQSWSRIFQSDQTEIDHSIWSTNRNFQNFGLNENKAPLDSSLGRILRFTSRLHTAYLPNYFQLFLLKFCHPVDQFNKWTSPKTVENKNSCGVQTWLTV